MDIYGPLLHRYKRMHERVHGSPVFRILDFLERSSRRPVEDIKKVQDARLRSLVHYAFKHSGYYHDAMRERDLRPDDIKGMEDLPKLPLIRRSDVRANLETMRTVEPERYGVRSNYTGGTTGEPMTFYQDAVYGYWNTADKFRTMMMTDYSIGDKIVRLWGAKRDTPHGGLYNHFRQKMRRDIWVDTFDLDPETTERAIRVMSRYRPSLVIGYTSSIEHMAREILRRKADVKVGALQSTAESLSIEQRELAEEAFGCKVFDRYGAREFGIIAHECDEHHGLHLSAEIHGVELVDDDGDPCESGHIAVTNFTNWTMPFIRYVIGDEASGITWERCECGRTTPRLHSIDGRLVDNFVLPDGTVVHGDILAHTIAHVSGIEQYQASQEKVDLVILRLLMAENAPESAAEEARKVLEERLGQDVEVRLDIGNIVRSSSGKSYRTHSKVWDEMRK